MPDSHATYIECLDDLTGGAYLTFAGKFGGEVDRNVLNETSQVGVAGCAAGSQIFKYTLHINANGRKSVFKGESHLLTDEILTSLRSLKKGDKFEFKEIRAQLPSGSKVDVLGRVFTVV